jgi:hypothetical protein
LLKDSTYILPNLFLLPKVEELLNPLPKNPGSIPMKNRGHEPWMRDDTPADFPYSELWVTQNWSKPAHWGEKDGWRKSLLHLFQLTTLRAAGEPERHTLFLPKIIGLRGC